MQRTHVVMATKPQGHAANMKSFSEALTALHPELLARALRLTADASKADDLVQDTMERALRFADSFAPDTNLRSWAHTVLFSVFASKWRKTRRERAALARFGAEGAWSGGSPVSQLVPCEPSPPVLRAMHQLGDTHREVLLRVDVEGGSYRDVAQELEVPIGTIMSRLHRARARLSELLGEAQAA